MRRSERVLEKSKQKCLVYVATDDEHSAWSIEDATPSGKPNRCSIGGPDSPRIYGIRNALPNPRSSPAAGALNKEPTRGLKATERFEGPTI